MVSAIDDTKPADGELAAKADFRANFAAAKAEIEALQDENAALRLALGLQVGAASFPPIPGDNLPTGPATLPTILSTLDQSVTNLANGNVAVTLDNITDILSPNLGVRSAFQAPLPNVTEAADFEFDEAIHTNRRVLLDCSSNSVNVTFDPAASLAQEDGFVCSLIPASGVNFASITGPNGGLRYQANTQGVGATHTVLFIGGSRSAGNRTQIDVYKDGTIYTLVGVLRTSESDDIRRNAPETVEGFALKDGSLQASAFPASLDLGGTKQVGGGVSLLRSVGGNTALSQADAGKIIVHTGSGSSTWDVPDLLDGTVIEVENDGGDIDLNFTGAKSVVGGSTIPAGGVGAVTYFGGKIRVIVG